MKSRSTGYLYREKRSFETILEPLLLAAVVVTVVGVVAVAAVQASVPSVAETADLALKGDQDGTVFRCLTVEDENRVQIRFERPELGLNIDPNQAPGLQLDDAMDILNRTRFDLVTPLLQVCSRTTSPYAPHPWLNAYTDGPVARFTPDMDGVASWQLQVVDSRGQTAMIFAGEDNPPTMIPWDGQRLDGTPAAPGYTYSYVLEAWDNAGNRRRIVGEGFQLPAYRRDDTAGPEFLVSGAQWQQDGSKQAGARRGGSGNPGHTPSALLLEAASRFNLRCAPTHPVRVIATHRTTVEATRLAELVAAELAPLLIGSADRVVVETQVEAGAPPDGTLCITARPVSYWE